MTGSMPVSLNLTDARELLNYLLGKAEEDMRDSVAICIVDATCKQICAAAMDNVIAPSVTAAYNKAVTALQFQRDTVAFDHVPYHGHWRSGLPTTEGFLNDNRWNQ